MLLKVCSGRKCGGEAVKSKTNAMFHVGGHKKCTDRSLLEKHGGPNV